MFIMIVMIIRDKKCHSKESLGKRGRYVVNESFNKIILTKIVNVLRLL